MESQTARKLSGITDEGFFERLATAVLRSARSDLYANLTHPGVNAEGKTVKGPVDGLCFVPGSCPRHMIAAHHTTAARDALRKKWLYEPRQVKRRKESRSLSTSPGDLIKTIAIASEERRNDPTIRVTLALTTNKEPPDDVTREIEAVAHANEIVLDIWSLGRIAHYLDSDPNGQWLRHEYLGTQPERLSRELLQKLSRSSLEAHRLPVQSDALIERELSLTIARDLARPVGFLVGGSGYGKTVACYDFLLSHIGAGGSGIVLQHGILGISLTLDQAIDASLRQLHPHLAPNSGADARALCSAADPLLIIVEDINRSGEAPALLERLARWSASTDRGVGITWRIICPAWPQLLASLPDEVRRGVESRAVSIGTFTPVEARAAIARRAALAEKTMLPLEIDAVAEGLGYDPLLIALHDLSSRPDPHTAIGHFIGRSTERIATTSGTLVADDYRAALQGLAIKLLQHRVLDPTWSDVRDWFGESANQQAAIRELTKNAEIIRLTDVDAGSHLAFRHDRVRLWLLVDGASALLRRGAMDNATFGDPFFAEIIGHALSDPSLPLDLAQWAEKRAPLALFYALKAFREPEARIHHAILASIERWLSDDKVHGRATYTLRWTALHILSQTDSSHVLRILNRFRDKGWSEIYIRFRHGDLSAGLRLCHSLEPGSNAPWRDQKIAHSFALYGDRLVAALDQTLRERKLGDAPRTGALRLAGHLGLEALSDAISECWKQDDARQRRLRDYLWATAQCGGSNTEALLNPVCAAWAALPDEKKDELGSTSRNSLASDDVRWAFSRVLPEPALLYFIKRATQEDLRWPITFMLHGVDHPDAVEFIAQELAKHTRTFEGKNSFWHFPGSVVEHWARQQQESGKPMSRRSRQRMRDIWQDQENDKHLRQQAFRIWAATSEPGDLPTLHAAAGRDPLRDDVLRARLIRGDKGAVGELIDRLRNDDGGYWWQFGRRIWSDELTAALDEGLTRRASEAKRTWNASYSSDWIIAELLMRLKPSAAESMLVHHWEHLRYSSDFLQAALHISSPKLRALVGAALAECPDPRAMLKYIDQHFGVKTRDHPGVTQIDQVEGLTPYLDYIDDSAIYRFWLLCNERGWFDFRRKHLDARLGSWRKTAGVDDETLISELDEELKRNRHPWMDHWVERHLSSGRQWTDILGILERWLTSNKTCAALSVAAAAIVHTGRRADVRHLRAGSDGSAEAAAIITDALFQIELRTLS